MLISLNLTNNKFPSFLVLSKS